jgi:glycosyltransferase involved in cell wall biosynthesis
MNRPKVSVVMPVFNGEKFLKEAIDSILNQTFTDFEFIIVNDGSTDNTRNIIQNYNDHRIKLLNNKSNLGISRAANIGIKASCGIYIARQDADDISMPERLEKEASFLDQNKNVGLVGTYYFVINENCKILNTIKCLTKSIELRKKLLEGNQFGHGTTMFRKEYIDKIGVYREEFKLAEDFDFYLRISEIYDVANIPEPLYKWRLNIKSVSVAKKALEDKYASLAIELAKERRQSGKDKLKSLKKDEIDKLLGELISDVKIQDKRKIAEGYCFWSRVLFGGKDYKGALILSLKSFINNPLNKNICFQILKNLVFLLFPEQV